jgi:quinol monooxygenase YgiN
MKNIPLTVLVISQAKFGMEDRVKAEIMSVVSRALEESTCTNIYFHQDINDSTRFMLYESWTDKEDFINVQMKSAHVQEYMNRCREFLVDFPIITMWESTFKGHGRALEENSEVSHNLL